MRRMIVAAMLAATAGALSLPAAARAHVDFIVGIAPPPPLYEVVPAARPGWIWAPGAWRWRYGRYVWVPGHWIGARPGFAYLPAGWVSVHGGWRWRAGGWFPARHHRW